jgi:hypothetical protein
MSIPAVVEGTVSRKMELKVAPIRRLYFTTAHGRFWLTFVPSGSEFSEALDFDRSSDGADEGLQTRASGGLACSSYLLPPSN